MTPTMFSICGQARQRGGFHVDAGAPLHAVHNDRAADGRGDGLVVLVEAFLGGLVVVGRDGEDAVRAQALQFARQFDDFARVVAARAAQHRHLALGLFDRDLDDAQMLGARERGAFAGGAAGNQEIDSGIDLAADQPAQRLFIERQIAPERSDQRRAASGKHVPPPKWSVSHQLQLRVKRRS